MVGTVDADAGGTAAVMDLPWPRTPSPSAFMALRGADDGTAGAAAVMMAPADAWTALTIPHCGAKSARCPAGQFAPAPRCLADSPIALPSIVSPFD